jgi:1-deoxy-D-xylulose-5-phosphate synthase
MIDKIKKAGTDELNEIAGNLRKRIISVVSATGGHLAPSLGVVELTVALHRVFDSPTDSIVWDVGHQAYAHKILTGRDGKFDTLRTKGGVSGFPKREESEHDAFGVGHSSTSISAALGIAEAKRITGEAGKSIAVIGDGSMTAGLAYEGLNNSGHVRNKRLIVILNDNQMSIDENVGALASFMNKGLTHPVYNRIKRDFKALGKIFSTKEHDLVELTRRAALVVKDFFLAGSLFEAFGFRYIGPIDGHDIESLVSTLENISKNIDADEEGARPVLLHVITRKGKGYEPAEQKPERFHGLGAFNVEDGSAKKSSGAPTYTKVFGETACDIMSSDSRVVAITAAMPSGTGLDMVRDRFPGRYYDVGIAEPHAAVFAAGLASRGLRPIVGIYSSFLQRSYDAIIHDVCLQNLPVIFAVDRAGVVGEDGPTHHGVFDLSYLRHVPNLVVMSPKDEGELNRMLKSAIGYNLPVAIRYPRGAGLGVEVGADVTPIELGKAETLSDPDDATWSIFAIGNMVKVASDAAKLLADKGISAAVINARFAKPMDKECVLDHAGRGRSILTIEDNVLAGGFGGGVLELLNSETLRVVNAGFANTKVIRCGYRDAFVEHASVKELHSDHGLTAEGIVDRIEKANRASKKDAASKVVGLK